MIRVIDAGTAFSALLSFLMFPAAVMLLSGLFFWYQGIQSGAEDKKRSGRLLTMFGIVFIVILLITSNFLSGVLPQRS